MSEILLQVIAAAVLLQLAASLALFLRQGGDRDAGERQERRLKEDLAAAREEAAGAARGLRDEVATTLKTLAELQKSTLDGLSAQMARLGQTVEMRLAKLQEDNGARLEQMRQTVDEKLQGTLEKRLGESFKLVSERLNYQHSVIVGILGFCKGCAGSRLVVSCCQETNASHTAVLHVFDKGASQLLIQFLCLGPLPTQHCPDEFAFAAIDGAHHC